MANNMNVTLDTTKQALDVHDGGNENHVNQSPNPQTISWQLTGNAASGSFNAIGATNPGFAWVGNNPGSIFGTPQVVANGNKITITDTNDSTSTTGTWTYQLWATIDDQEYSTVASLGPTETTTNPIIKNN